MLDGFLVFQPKWCTTGDGSIQFRDMDVDRTHVHLRSPYTLRYSTCGGYRSLRYNQETMPVERGVIIYMCRAL